MPLQSRGPPGRGSGVARSHRGESEGPTCAGGVRPRQAGNNPLPYSFERCGPLNDNLLQLRCHPHLSNQRSCWTIRRPAKAADLMKAQRALQRAQKFPQAFTHLSLISAAVNPHRAFSGNVHGRQGPRTSPNTVSLKGPAFAHHLPIRGSFSDLPEMPPAAHVEGDPRTQGRLPEGMSPPPSRMGT